MKAFHVLCLILAIVTSPQLVAQDASPSSSGISPIGSYEGQDVYTVDLASGNVVGHIPIASYPQRGSLPPLELFVNFNLPSFTLEETCDFGVDTCMVWYDPLFSHNGAQPMDSYGGLGIGVDEAYWQGIEYPAGAPQWSMENYYVKDSTGASHAMLFDYNTNNLSSRPVLHAVDGSGYSASFPVGSNLFNKYGGLTPGGDLTPVSKGTLYDKHGIAYYGSAAAHYFYSPPYDSLIFPVSHESAADPSGNTIQYVPAVKDSSGNILTYQHYFDSVGRTIPLGGPQDGNGSTCPDLGQANQPALDAYDLSLPAANGTTQKYKICYTQVKYRTAYFFSDANGIPADEDSYPQADPLNFDNGTQVPIKYETVGYIWAVQSIVLPDGKCWGIIYDASTTTQKGGKTYSSQAYGDVSQILFPSGGSTTFTYTDGAPEFEQPLVPVDGNGNVLGVVSVINRMVRSVTRNDANGGIVSTVYDSYRGATKNQQITDVVDSFSNVTRHTFTDFASSNQLYETQTDYYQGAATGTPLKTVSTSYIYQAGIPDPYPSGVPAIIDNVLPSSITTSLNGSGASKVVMQYPSLWTLVRPACGYFGSLLCTFENKNDGSGDLAVVNMLDPTPSVQRYYDGSGNLLKTVKSTSKYSTDSRYKAVNQLDRISSVEVDDSNSTQASMTTYGYDEDNGSPQGDVQGNQTSVNSWLNTAGQNITSSTVYNNQGMPSKVIDPKGDITSISYDTSGLYVSSVTYPKINDIQQVDSYTWDYNTGKMSSHTDPNGAISEYSYDSSNRIIKVRNAVGTSAENSMTYTYPSASQVTITQDRSSINDGVLQSSIIYDGFLRPIQTIAPGKITSDTQYNSAGLVAYKSNPHSSLSSSIHVGTSFTYDVLGRMTQQTMPDGTSDLWSYMGNNVTYADENRRTWSRSYDALGRLTHISEPNGTSSSPSLDTEYGYDVLGNLLSVTQKGTSGIDTARNRSFTYDSLSRLLCSYNPETSSASCPASAASVLPTSGATLYTYDSNSNLHSKTDARGVTTSFGYDALNRLLSKSYSGSTDAAAAIAAATPSSCYQYDQTPSSLSNVTITNPIGRLTAEWTQTGGCPSSGQLPSSGFLTSKVILGYDPMGRIKGEKQCTSSSCSSPYSFAYDYDLAGNVTGANNGVGSITWQPTYDSAGRLLSVGSLNAWSGPQFSTQLFSSPTYGPVGITGWSMGSPVPGGSIPPLTFQKTYDNRLRTTSETVTGNH